MSWYIQYLKDSLLYWRKYIGGSELRSPQASICFMVNQISGHRSPERKETKMCTTLYLLCTRHLSFNDTMVHVSKPGLHCTSTWSTERAWVLSILSKQFTECPSKLIKGRQTHLVGERADWLSGSGAISLVWCEDTDRSSICDVTQADCVFGRDPHQLGHTWSITSECVCVCVCGWA